MIIRKVLAGVAVAAAFNAPLTTADVVDTDRLNRTALTTDEDEDVTVAIEETTEAIELGRHWCAPTPV